MTLGHLPSGWGSWEPPPRDAIASRMRHEQHHRDDKDKRSHDDPQSTAGPPDLGDSVHFLLLSEGEPSFTHFNPAAQDGAAEG
jgi:hypothetical protein